jgi:hypothetical protein
MKKENARRSILREWDAWATDNLASDHEVTGSEGLVFFVYLQKHRPGLLDFRHRGDKWQAVRGWLLWARKVKN